jgi:integrase
MWRAPTGTDRLFPLSDTAVRRLCRQIAGKPVTLHGFRSSSRDWCAENGVSRDLAEAARAHAIKGKTETACNRTSMIEQRREVMERWATFAYDTVNFST